MAEEEAPVSPRSAAKDRRSPKLAAQRHPRLALPFTVLTDRDTVRLVAGEDYRYTLTGPGLESWLPPLLARFNGHESLACLIDSLSCEQRDAANELVERLYGERVLVDGTVLQAHRSGEYRLVVEGTGPLVEMIGGVSGAATSAKRQADSLLVLCQDRLDYRAALEFSRRCRAEGVPWLWVTTGPMSRGYVSPVFLPDAGPCFACLLRHFQRLSPAPELYDALLNHPGPITPVAFPSEGMEILRQVVLWKRSALAEEHPSAALYRLHALEVDGFEVTTHRVFLDPECAECGNHYRSPER